MRAVLFAGIVAVVVNAAPVEAAKARWQGTFVITTATGTCNDYDPTGGRGLASFEPELTGTDNGAGSNFTLVEDVFTYAYQLHDGFGVFTDVFKQVDTMYVGTSGFGPDDTANVKLRFVKQTPPAAKLKKTSPFITITAEIQNFNYMPGCTVSVNAALVKRPQ